MTLVDIEATVQAFGDAAARAVATGCDLVEVHAAHGYLITNFLSPHTNRRSDDYGGSFENRSRLLKRVVREIRSKIPAGFPLSVRVSVTDYESNGITVDETVDLCRMLQGEGVDVIHASGGHHARMEYEVSPWYMPRSPHRSAWERIKDAISIPVMASGSIVSPELAAEIVGSGSADFVSLGRPMLADPDWVSKAAQDRTQDIVPCIRCNDGCLHRGLHLGRSTGCAVNPEMGAEYRFPVVIAAAKRKVAVVGGGPAGLRTAQVLSDRGHEVTLFEGNALGGQLAQASALGSKQDLRALLAHLLHAVNQRPINVVTRRADAATLKDGGFDLVCLATGRRPRAHSLEVDAAAACIGIEALESTALSGGPAVVVGAGVSGCHAALRLRERGVAHVTLIDMEPRIPAGDHVFTDASGMPLQLRDKGIHVLSTARVRRISQQEVEVTHEDGIARALPATLAVLATGWEADTGLLHSLREQLQTVPLELVGTSRGGTRIMDALHDGFFVGRRL